MAEVKKRVGLVTIRNDIACGICYDTHNDEEVEMVQLPCDHNFCRDTM